MELLTLLANFGGLGICAGMLFLLHREALKAFRDELKAEREDNARVHLGYMTTIKDGFDSLQSDFRFHLAKRESSDRKGA